MTSLRTWPVAGVALLVLLLTGCTRAVAGVGETGTSSCVPAADDAVPRQPAPPTDAPVITVDDRISFWISNWQTAPLGLAVYADGTVIRAQGSGAHDEPLPPMEIGRIDVCAVRQAVDALIGLRGADFGDPAVTDLGTTTVTVTGPGSRMVTLSAYGLGIGDEYVEADQAAARSALGDTIVAIGSVDEGTAAPWTPDRLQLTRFQEISDEPSVSWPLIDPIADVVPSRSDAARSCGVVEGADADAIINALDGGPVATTWDDGSERATLGIGVLVPGQPACTR